MVYRAGGSNAYRSAMMGGGSSGSNNPIGQMRVAGVHRNNPLNRAPVNVTSNQAQSRRVSPATRAPQMPYQAEGGQARATSDTMRRTGEQFLDPRSDYVGRLRDEMSKDIGGRGAAMERAAALRAARAGMGAGASPELLETQGDIGRGTMEAIGDASADLTLAGPEMAARFLNPALSADMGLQGHSLNAFMGQQRLDQERENTQANIDLAERRMEFDELRAEEEAMLRELMMLQNFYGGIF